MIARERRASGAGARSEFAPVLGQLQGRALPLAEAYGVGPVDVSTSDAVERGDSVAGTAAGRGVLGVCDRDPGAGLAGGLVGLGECLPCLNVSRHVSCTNACTNQPPGPWSPRLSRSISSGRRTPSQAASTDRAASRQQGRYRPIRMRSPVPALANVAVGLARRRLPGEIALSGGHGLPADGGTEVPVARAQPKMPGRERSVGGASPGVPRRRR